MSALQRHLSDLPPSPPLAMLPEMQSEASAGEVHALRQQANRLQSLLQVMPAGVIVVGADGLVKQANQQALSLLGEPLTGERWRNIIQRAFCPREDDGHEVSLHNGRRVKLSITPLQGEPGQLILITDLTETRQLQERVSHMQRLSSLGKMVASLAHQIRTPLSAAMLYAMNLSGQALGDKARNRFVDKLQSRLRDLEMQVNDMLLFAKSGEQQVVEFVSTEQLFAEVQQGCDAMLSNAQAHLKIENTAGDSGVMANQRALTGAIQNLIHNAVQVCGQGVQIILSADINNNQCVIRVQDNGPGIDDNQLNQIFEPFYTTQSQGTGLGLAVVKAVALAHHGQVKASNAPQGGAVFSLSLPLAKQATATGATA